MMATELQIPQNVAADQLRHFIRLLPVSFGLCAALLIGGNIAQDLALAGYLPIQLSDKIWMLDVDEEAVPFTWLSSVVLFTNGLILLGIFRLRKSHGVPLSGYWLALAIGFFFLSLDEAVSIHERLGDVLPSGSGKLVGAGWVVAAVPALIVVGAVFLRFLSTLPRLLACLFVSSGILFVGGAVVVEAVGASIYGLGSEAMGNRLLIALEESLEMTGALLFMFSLSRFWSYCCARLPLSTAG